MSNVLSRQVQHHTHVSIVEPFDAVVKHEIAHLKLRHHRHLLLIQTYPRLCAWLPFSTTAIDRLRVAVEQWADHAAVHAFGAGPDALQRAAHALGRAEIGTAQHPPKRARRFSSELAGINLLIAVVICSAVYAVAHSVGDIADVLATAHQ